MYEHTNGDEQNGFVERQIRRVSRNLLVGNGMVLGLLALVVWLVHAYLGWFLHGPQRMDDADILNAARAPGGGLIAYADIRNHRLIPTEYIEESSQDGKVYSVTDYHFIAVGKKLMLVKASRNAAGNRLIGPLQAIHVKSDREALDGIVGENPALRGRILPVMLNAAAAFMVGGYILIGILSPIFLLCVYNIARATIRSGKSRLHPVTRSIAKQGDPRVVARAIDAEMAEPAVLRIGKAFMTRNWVLRPTLFRLIACRLDDVVWAYHAIISGDNIAALAFRDGRIVSIPLQGTTPEFLSQIRQRLPWVETGWTQEKARKWRTERAAFLEEVDARRIGHDAQIPRSRSL